MDIHSHTNALDGGPHFVPSEQEVTQEFLETEMGKEEQEVVAKAQRVVEKIFEWAQKNHIEIAHVKKLSGGHVNMVLLIETPEGDSLVVKAFSDKVGAQITKEAQTRLSQIAKADQSFIPKAIAWIDDETLVSSKAEGYPIRKLLAAISEESGIEQAHQGFSDLGKMLGNIHEKTERVLTSEDDPTLYRRDVGKVLDHLHGYVARGVLPFSEEEHKAFEQKIRAFTEGGAVSVVHGDAHLDQFFCAPDKSVVTIVDYDTLHEGDPMADVARVLASTREWGEETGIAEENLRHIESAFFNGYRSVRFENLPMPKSEFDQQRIIVYELRLSLIQLWQYNDLLDELEKSVPEGMTHGAFLAIVQTNPEERERLKGTLSPKQQDRFDAFLRIFQRATEIFAYLKQIEIEENAS